MGDVHELKPRAVPVPKEGEPARENWEAIAKDSEYRNMVLLQAIKAIISLPSASMRQRQIAAAALHEIRRDAREHDPEPPKKAG